jgi:hypothetical protein
MNTIHTTFTSSNVDPAQEGTAQEPQGSVMAFMMQYQHLLNKEARDDRQLQQREQAQLRQREEQIQQLQGQLLAQQSPGFFQSIGKFLTGNDAGSGNLENGSTLSEKARQPQAAWNDWRILKVR